MDCCPKSTLGSPCVCLIDFTLCDIACRYEFSCQSGAASAPKNKWKMVRTPPCPFNILGLGVNFFFKSSIDRLGKRCFIFMATDLDAMDLGHWSSPPGALVPACGDISYHCCTRCHLFSSSSQLNACGRRCHGNTDCV